MGIRQNLIALITRENITQETLARTIGRTQGAVSQWINGSKPPSMASIRRICDAYNLAESDLLSDKNGLYAQIHGLTEAPAGAIAVRGAKSAFVPIRVLGKVHAGALEEEEPGEDMAEVPASLLENHPRAFALLTEGTCMNRVIAQGEVVLVDPDMTPSRGSIVVAETEAYEAIMRRWFMGATKLMLSPDSYDEYDDLVFEYEDGSVTVLGVVFWHQAAKELK